MNTETEGRFTGCPHGCTNLCLRTESDNLQTHINNVAAKAENDNKYNGGLGFIAVKNPKYIVDGLLFNRCLHSQRGY